MVPPASGRDRRRVVVAAVAIQLCLGVIYAWSPIKALLVAGFGWSHAEASLPFSVAVATNALVSVAAGRWQDRVGPRRVATAGGLLYGIGTLLAGLGRPPTLAWMVATYGLVAGAGVGLAYVCPIAALVKWFPERRGLITGVAVAGFGAGALVFSALIPLLAPTADTGLATVLIAFGATFLAVVTLSAQALEDPPAGYRPEGWEPPREEAGAALERGGREVLATREFWLLWALFLVGSGAGLMTIGHVAGFVAEALSRVGAANAAGTAIAIVGLLSAANAAGRLAWGAASDRLGRPRAMSLMFLLQALAMAALPLASSPTSLAALASLVGFNFGGNFALFPSAAADLFGTQNMGANYGMLITAFGVAGLAGPLLGGWARDALGSYDAAFLGAAALCAAAAALARRVPAAPDEPI